MRLSLHHAQQLPFSLAGVRFENSYAKEELVIIESRRVMDG